MDSKAKEELEKRKKEKWFDVWFAIEALAKDEDVVKKALEKHVEKLAAAKNIFVYEKRVREAQGVENPMKGVDKAFSQVVEIRLMIRDLFTLLNTVMLFGPSAIEVLGPAKKEISLDEVQNMANQLAGIVHQFAAAGMGGIIISPSK